MQALPTPLEGWVLVEPLEPVETKSASGLVIMQDGQDERRQNIALVLKVPEKCPVEEGQTVFYKGYAGQDVFLNEKRYLFVEFQDIFGVL